MRKYVPGRGAPPQPFRAADRVAPGAGTEINRLGSVSVDLSERRSESMSDLVVVSSKAKTPTARPIATCRADSHRVTIIQNGPFAE